MTKKILIRSLLAIAALGGAVPAGAADTVMHVPFTLDSGRRVAYQVELEATHPGTLQVASDWPGARILTFKLTPLDGGKAVRRAGPTPQALEVRVVQASPEKPSRWKLEILGVPARGSGQAVLRVTLPGPPEPEPTRSSSPGVADAPSDAIEPWPLSVPEGWLPWAEQARSFAEARVQTRHPDACRWQAGFATFLRDFAAGETATPELDRDSRRLLGGLAAMIQRVDELRTSQDSILSGPPPADPVRREAWLRVRASRLQSLEAELDRLQVSLDREEPAALAGQSWPARLASCVMACERHFDERAVVGERGATNLELVRQQWSTILEAAAVLDAQVRLPSP